MPKCNTMVEADGIRKGKGAKGKAAVKKAKSKPAVEELEDEDAVRASDVVFSSCMGRHLERVRLWGRPGRSRWRRRWEDEEVVRA